MSAAEEDHAVVSRQADRDQSLGLVLDSGCQIHDDWEILIMPDKKETQTLWKHMGVSKNRDTPKWMVYNGKAYFLMDDNGGFHPYVRKHPHGEVEFAQLLGLRSQLCDIRKPGVELSRASDHRVVFPEVYSFGNLSNLNRVIWINLAFINHTTHQKHAKTH